MVLVLWCFSFNKFWKKQCWFKHGIIASNKRPQLIVMSGYQWRGYGSSWNSRGGGGRFSSYNYPLGKSAGKGNGKNSSLPSLLNQLQSEIAAQQQLQAIASVLTPAVVNTPASSHHVAESAPPQDASFKLLQDEIAALRAELAKSQPPQATQVEPDAVQLFSEIVKEVSQLRQNQLGK